MKVIFNGLLQKKSSGCNCRKQTSEYSFVNSKLYIMPSGASKRFYKGKVEEVTDRDGEFLLSYRVTDANGTRSVFTKVEE